MKRGNAKRTPRNLTDSVEIRGERKKRQPPQHVRAVSHRRAARLVFIRSRPCVCAPPAPSPPPPPTQAWDTPKGSSRAGGDGSVADDFVTSSDPWAEEEDAVLREGVLKFGTENWAAVAHHLVPPVTGGPLKRSPDACKERWDTVVRHNAVKGPWLPEEDELLRKLVGEIGPKRWALIASNIPGRAGKQCRERWLNHLDTNVRKGEWTTEEDELLLATQHRVGNKWSEIARLLPGRAENAVKNRFNSLIAKQLPYGLSASLDVPEDDPRSMVKPEPGLDEDEAEAEEAALEAKKGKELLQYMFSKIGNQRRGPRIPQSPRTSTESFEFEGEDGEDDTDAPAEVELVDEHGAASRRPDRFRINLQLQEDSSDDDDDDDDAEQDEEDEDGMADGAPRAPGVPAAASGTILSFAKRAYDREVERNDLFRNTAISSMEWRELEDRVAAQAPEQDAEDEEEAEDDGAEEGPLRRPKVCDSPGARGRRGATARGGFDHDADHMRLSETLTSLSLEDSTWLADAALGLASTTNRGLRASAPGTFRGNGSAEWAHEAGATKPPARGASGAQATGPAVTGASARSRRERSMGRAGQSIQVRYEARTEWNIAVDCALPRLRRPLPPTRPVTSGI